jgi:Mitochondrial K+-H+ exchange-related
LLWHLRRLDAARLVHPDDLSPPRALDAARAVLRRESDKHRRWFAIDGVLMLLCLPLTVIPGPNVPSIYFTFRAVGHFLSMRGARRGLSGIAWTLDPSMPLTSLRQALRLTGGDRHATIGRVGADLGLERLAAFVDRLAS